MSYQNNYPYIQYETYEIEPYDNYSPKSNENFYQSDFTKQQYISYPNDISTSFSSTDKILTNKKYYETNSFESELRRKYDELKNGINNNICNCDCHKKFICYCDCNNKNNNNKLNINLNINEVLNELSDLKFSNVNLNNDINRIKKEKQFADDYIKELEKENEKIKKDLNDNYINKEEYEKIKKDLNDNYINKEEYEKIKKITKESIKC